MLTGVVEVGLFCNVTQAAYFGNQVLSFSPINVRCLWVDSVPQDGSVTVKKTEGSQVVEERIDAA